MKQIIFAKSFRGAYRERIAPHPQLVKIFHKKIKLFKSDKSLDELYIHELGGRMLGLSAFSLGYDLRIIYKETESIIIFIDIGTHPQVYR